MDAISRDQSYTERIGGILTLKSIFNCKSGIPPAQGAWSASFIATITLQNVSNSHLSAGSILSRQLPTTRLPRGHEHLSVNKDQQKRISFLIVYQRKPASFLLLLGSGSFCSSERGEEPCAVYLSFWKEMIVNWNPDNVLAVSVWLGALGERRRRFVKNVLVGFAYYRLANWEWVKWKSKFSE